MWYAIQQYFESCWDVKQVVTIQVDGNRTLEHVKYQREPYTMAGLALALGISTATLRAYGQDGLTSMIKSWETGYNPRPEFIAIVQRAKLFIEGFCEKQIHEGRNANTVFNLMQCNFGYRMPKQEVELNQTGSMNITSNNERARETRARMLAELAASNPLIAKSARSLPEDGDN